MGITFEKCARCDVPCYLYSKEVYTSKDEEKICLRCKVFEDMKLPEGTIYSQNLVLLWENKKFDKNGINPYYLLLSEGIHFYNTIPELYKDFKNDKRKGKEFICSKITYKGNKNSRNIEKFVNKMLKQKKYDVMTVFKINQTSDFYICCINFSNRMIDILNEKDTIFVKEYCLWLCTKWLRLKSKEWKKKM